jgi:signal peptidase
MKKIVYNIALGFFLLAFAMLILPFIPFLGNGFKELTVLSGSMEPTIKTGSVIFIKAQADYKIGDVITFALNDVKIPVTHRIKEMQVNSGVPYYVTKGDANNGPDQNLVPRDKVIGRVLFSVPFVGYAVEFIKKPIGFLVVILIPVAMIIIDRAIKIKEELKKSKETT